MGLKCERCYDDILAHENYVEFDDGIIFCNRCIDDLTHEYTPDEDEDDFRYRAFIEDEIIRNGYFDSDDNE